MLAVADSSPEGACPAFHSLPFGRSWIAARTTRKGVAADQLVGPPSAYLWRWLLNAGTHQLPGGRAQELLDSVLDIFTTRGRASRMHYWIWEDLRPPTLSLPAPNELGALLNLGPPSTPVWLIVEDWDGTKRGAPFWIFEATLSATIATLKNHHLLEFYIVSRPLTWLVGENHHDVLFAAGELAISALQTTGR